MRTLRTPCLLALIALMAAPAATAADECSQATPCHWFVDVDADGLQATGAAAWNFTVGDWFVLNVTNFDEVPHAIALTGHPVTLQVPAADSAETAPFQFTTAGTFELRDDAGHKGIVTVTRADVNDYQGGVADSDGNDLATTTKGAPAPGAWLAAMALASIAAALRMRRPPP